MIGNRWKRKIPPNKTHQTCERSVLCSNDNLFLSWIFSICCFCRLLVVVVLPGKTNFLAKILSYWPSITVQIWFVSQCIHVYYSRSLSLSESIMWIESVWLSFKWMYLVWFDWMTQRLQFKNLALAIHSNHRSFHLCCARAFVWRCVTCIICLIQIYLFDMLFHGDNSSAWLFL